MAKKAKKINLENLGDYEIGILRQRVFDLEEDDNSKDDKLKELTEKEVVKHLVAWEIGDSQYMSFVLGKISMVTGNHNLMDEIFGEDN